MSPEAIRVNLTPRVHVYQFCLCFQIKVEATRNTDDFQKKPKKEICLLFKLPLRMCGQQPFWDSCGLLDRVDNISRDPGLVTSQAYVC